MPTSCSVDGCNQPVHVKSRGLCRTHYNRWHSTGSTDLGGRVVSERGPCTVDGCDRIVFHLSKGLCKLHYARDYRTGTTANRPPRQPCLADGCDRLRVAHGYCSTHWDRVKRNGSPELPARRLATLLESPSDGICTVDGCDGPVHVKKHGLCRTHYARYARHGDPTAWVKPIRQLCSADGCHLRSAMHGMCHKHFKRVQRYGATELPDRPPRTEPVAPERRCRQCGGEIEDSRRWRLCSKECAEIAAYHQRQATHRERWLKRYGLTVEQYDTMLADQGSACAICRRTDPGARGWCVDHCHDTGQVRGILCMGCNSAIGHLSHDPDTLRAAIAYLER